ncbi:hypothetical protein SAMD00019534_046070, partial [Acytostelium subglobosum LB1]|uniref:hypothetical protein n=1 Tax=Acytostelium subglobosum LB1 TaxID=1410327 RepID=UPI000644C576
CNKPDDCKNVPACQAASCTRNKCQLSPVNCDDGNVCTTDSCDLNNRCVYTPVNCDDGNLCTIDSCQQNQCQFTPINCDDGNICTTDSCSLDRNACQHNKVDNCCRDVSECPSSTCHNVTCSSTNQCQYTPFNCDDGDVCTSDSCSDSANSCQHTKVNCDDGDVCTSDSCSISTNSCQHTKVDNCCHNAVDCPSRNCSTSTCQTNQCNYSPVNCDDGNVCTNDRCDVGSRCCLQDSDCQPSNPCSIAKCSADTNKCQETPKSCDDGDVCTTDSCSMSDGQCIHTKIPGCCHTASECPPPALDCTRAFCVLNKCYIPDCVVMTSTG